jgi:membrane-bound metal-dependent hydrolase YbcI (DUF457 family)
MIFWHLGATLFLFLWIFKDRTADLRYLLVGSLLPDLLDKFLYLVVVTDSSRTYGHTLLLGVLTLFIVMFITNKENSNRKSYLLVPIALFFHLLLDEMWLFKETLFWPIFDGQFSQHISSADSLLELFIISINKTEILIKEFIGVVCLFFVLNEDRKFKSNFSRIIRTGKY